MTPEAWRRWRAERRERARLLDDLRRAIAEAEEQAEGREQLQGLLDEVLPEQELSGDELREYVDAQVERLRAEGRWPYGDVPGARRS